MTPYSSDHSIDVNYCGESQGCLIVPEKCNINGKCDYILAWQGLDDQTVKFNLVARSQGFAGVGFSTDERRVCSTRLIFFFDRERDKPFLR